MPNEWMPGIEHDPGANSDGATNQRASGISDMATTVIHYTAGAYGGDYAVGKRGYFNFYIPREQPTVQFAKASAITWHAGDFNIIGPGIELELLNDSIDYTPKQLDDLGRVAHWLMSEWGFPNYFFDTGGDNSLRRPPGQVAPGFTTHRSLDQSPDNHTDYITVEEWLRAVGDEDMATWKDWTLAERLEFSKFIEDAVDRALKEKLAADNIFTYGKFIQEQVQNAATK